MDPAAGEAELISACGYLGKRNIGSPKQAAMLGKIPRHEMIEMLPVLDPLPTRAANEPLFAAHTELSTKPIAQKIFQSSRNIKPRSIFPPTHKQMNMRRFTSSRVQCPFFTRTYLYRDANQNMLYFLIENNRRLLCIRVIFPGLSKIARKISRTPLNITPSMIRTPTPIRVIRKQINRHLTPSRPRACARGY